VWLSQALLLQRLLLLVVVAALLPALELPAHRLLLLLALTLCVQRSHQQWRMILPVLVQPLAMLSQQQQQQQQHHWQQRQQGHKVQAAANQAVFVLLHALPLATAVAAVLLQHQPADPRTLPPSTPPAAALSVLPQ
jgi:hypothetical protein